MKTIIAIAVASTVFLVGCGSLTNEQQGVLIGATAGGIIGNQVGGGSGKAAATLLGAIVGGAIGGNIGRSLDVTDRARLAQALETSPSGHTTTWTNPDRGTRYEVTPRPAKRTGNHVCREYTMTGVINGKREQIVGTACRQPDGSWRAVP